LQREQTGKCLLVAKDILSDTLFDMCVCVLLLTIVRAADN